MGDPKKHHKKYSKPTTPYDKPRIEEEKELIEQYGLKNKSEIWKAVSFIRRIRTQAKKLILEPENQEEFFARLVKLGLIKKEDNLDDVLDLTKEKLLDRRLQSFVFKKGLAKSQKQARQLIVHKKVKISERIVDSPSHIVKINEENQISIIKLREKSETAEKPQIKLELKPELESAEAVGVTESVNN